MAFAWSNHWVRPAFGFNIQEVIDLFDSWGWVVNLGGKSVFCVFGLGAGYTRISVYLFALV